MKKHIIIAALVMLSAHAASAEDLLFGGLPTVQINPEPSVRRAVAVDKSFLVKTRKVTYSCRFLRDLIFSATLVVAKEKREFDDFISELLQADRILKLEEGEVVLAVAYRDVFGGIVQIQTRDNQTAWTFVEFLDVIEE